MNMRKGLSQSLEDYAASFVPPLDTETVRVTWRLQGIRFLFPQQTARMPLADLVPLVSQVVNGRASRYSPRIAPGLRVPTPGYECEIER
jgi:hypothetical protein